MAPPPCFAETHTHTHGATKISLCHTPDAEKKQPAFAAGSPPARLHPPGSAAGRGRLGLGGRSPDKGPRARAAPPAPPGMGPARPRGGPVPAGRKGAARTINTGGTAARNRGETPPNPPGGPARAGRPRGAAAAGSGSILALPRPTFPLPPLPPPPRPHSPPRISAAAAAAGPRYPPVVVAGSRGCLRSRVRRDDGRGARRMAADCAGRRRRLRPIRALAASSSSPSSRAGPAPPRSATCRAPPAARGRR